MNAVVNILTQPTTAASAGGSSNGAKSSGKSGGPQDIFAALLDLASAAKNSPNSEVSDFAASILDGLLGRTEQSGEQADAPFAASLLLEQSSNASINIDVADLAELQAAIGTGEDGEPTDPMSSLMGKLVAALEGLLTQKNGVGELEISAEAQTAANGAMAMFGQLLDTIEKGLSANASGANRNVSDLSPELVDQLTQLSALMRNLRADAAGSTTGMPDDLSAALETLDRRVEQMLQVRANPVTEAATAHKQADMSSENVMAALAGKADADRSARDLQTHLLRGGDASKDTAAPRPDLGATTDAKPDAKPAAAAGAGTAHRDGDAGAQRQAANAAANAGTGAGAGIVETKSESKFDSLLAIQAQASNVARADAGSPMRMATAPYTSPQAQLNMPQIAFEMVRQVSQGNSRFQIRLDPPELGRIDVRMDIDKSGNLHARLTVERSETLDLLQRDARVLERALAQSGLESSRTSLEFSLKQNPFARQDGQQGQQQDFAGGLHDADPASSEDTTLPPVHLYRGTASPGGLNLWA